jgi:hypothetical protein
MSPRQPHGRHRPVPMPSPLAQAVLLAVGALALALLVMQLTAPRWHEVVTASGREASVATTASNP